MASNYTTNYQLNQWEARDQVLRTEFNQDNQKIDTALAANAEAIAAEVVARTALAETVAGKGNCQLHYSAYTGNGNTSRTFTFSGPPRFLCIMGGGSDYFLLAVQGAPFSVCYGNGTKDYGTPSWSGNSVTITVVDDYRTDFICNASGKSYFLIALTEAG